jgi:hypothetical protein
MNVKDHAWVSLLSLHPAAMQSDSELGDIAGAGEPAAQIVTATRMNDAASTQAAA